MATVLEIKGLRKKYGRQVALDDLEMSVPEGTVTALVGANGAGKTTTFSLIGGFFRADSGSIQVMELPLKRYRGMGGVIGLLPQDVLFFQNRTVARQLKLFANLAGFLGADANDEVERVLELVQLSDRVNALPSDLSHGMKVRFGVAQALIGNPPLVLLDEPTAGLDPKMVNSFREMVKNIKGQTTLVISSHDLNQLEQMCDYICMIDHGKLVRQGPLKELLAESSRIMVRYVEGSLDFAAFKGDLAEFTVSLGGHNELFINFDSGKFNIQGVNLRIMQWLVAHKVGVLSIDCQQSLEERYLEETKDRSI